MSAVFPSLDNRLYSQALSLGLIAPAIEAARKAAGASGERGWRFLVSRHAFWECAVPAFEFYLAGGGDPFNRMAPAQKAHALACAQPPEGAQPPSEAMCRALLYASPPLWQLAVETNAAPIVRLFFSREPEVARREVDWEGLSAWDWASRANAADSLAVLRELGFGPDNRPEPAAAPAERSNDRIARRMAAFRMR